MVSGTAARCVQRRAIDEATALADIDQILRGLTATTRQEVLDQAAAGVSRADPGPGGWWYPASRELLAKAGADLERAAAIAATYGAGLNVPPAAGST